MSKITIVIPDTGPLITLAKANALSLLLAFGDDVSLVLTDVVAFEATRFRSDHEDAQQICDFIDANAQRISIRDTSYGELAISAAKARQRYDESPGVQALYAANQLPPPAKIASDSGELSIISFITSLIGDPPGPPCLIIAEDDFFLRSNSGALPGNAHIISTVAFLMALQVLDPKCNADAVLAAATTADRQPNSANVDKPAEKIKGSSSWKDTLEGDKLKVALSTRRKNIKNDGGAKP